MKIEYSKGNRTSKELILLNRQQFEATKFDVDTWDRQFEADVKSGKLDVFADKALHAHTSGQSKPLSLR